MSPPTGVYSFHFPVESELLGLFAVGRQDIRDPHYRWDGLARGDGPLLLFQYTLAGLGVLETEEEFPLPQGQAFLVEIPSAHVYRIDPDQGRWEVLFVLLRPAGALPLWRSVIQRLGRVTTLPETSPTVRTLFDLVQSAASQQITDQQTASLLLYRFLMELHRHAHGTDTVPWPPAITEAVKLLDAGWNRPWKLPEVAGRVGLSPSHFHRLFRKHTGLSPLEWLTRKRMEKAVELLHGQTVKSVARTLGFEDTGYFIRVFRRWMGVTPGALQQTPSAWVGSKIVLSSVQFSDRQPEQPTLD